MTRNEKVLFDACEAAYEFIFDGKNKQPQSVVMRKLLNAMDDIDRDTKWLDDLRYRYENQDNCGTAFPIFVQVQELVCIGAIDEERGVCCPYGDGEDRLVYVHHALEDHYEDRKELLNDLREHYCEDEKELERERDNIGTLMLGYIWHPVEFFLTIEGAEEYMKCNKHNHGKLRTWVSHFERRNFEMRALLEAIDFKVND